MNRVQGRRRHASAGRMAWVLMLLAWLLPAAVMAQGAPQMFTAADRAEIAHFKLDQDVLDRLQALTAEGQALHIQSRSPDMSNVHSLDDMAAQLVAIDPRIKPLLAKHGFTAHQFVVANLALVRTAMAVRMQGDPDAARYMAPGMVDPANVAFFKAHEAQIDRMLSGGADPRQP